MLLKSLAAQFVHDLKANRAKTAVLAVLLAVGMYFWIPPLYRAVMGTRSEARTPQASPSQPVAPAATQSDSRQSSSPASSSSRAASGGNATGWELAEQTLRTDPLVRSAELSDLSEDPFQIDQDQFSPPLLFAEEPPEARDTGRTLEAGPPSGLVLKSTIIGPTERAAFINRKLYREGTEILFDDRTYHLEAVYPRRVLLSHAGNVFELVIADKELSGNVQVQRD